MKRTMNFSIGTVVLVLMLTASMGVQAAVATGVVFKDKNENGVLDKGEKGIAKVRVSNGREVVQTDRKGRYELPVDDDTIFFVIKPSGWMTPVNELQLPRFHYIHKPAGSPAKLKYPGVAPTGDLPESVNFPLIRAKENDTFKVVMFGDTQTSNQTEVDYLAHDILEELEGTDAIFGVTLGDVANNNLSVSEPIARAVSMVGIPWYNVLGNHDENYDVPNNVLSDESYERLYGPSTYSFEYGDVHFIVLDDVFWEGKKYHAELTEEQLAFLKNDLAFIDDDQLVVLMMHIPVIQITNKEAFFDILKDYNTLSISAHFHTHRHMFLTEKDGWPGDESHHHLIHGTACGGWWSGVKDIRGLPHATMADGVPNGYSIFTFDDDTWSMEYKPASLPASFQMHIHLPEAIARADLAATEMLVNIFNGSERSTAAMRVDSDGDWLSLAQCEAEDPAFLRIQEFESKLPKGLVHNLPKSSGQNHFWKGMLPAGIAPGTHKLYIRTTDMHGQTYTNVRVFRVE